MNPPEAQSDSEPTATYFDPETPDMSEQQFSASLETEFERPKFVVDSSDAPAEAEPPAKSAGSGPSSHDGHDAPPAASEMDDAAPDSDWRDQVSAKVNNYKSRRPRTDRYPSLQLQFDTGAYRGQKSEARPNAPPSFSESVAAEVRNLQPEPRILLEATARVLEFPRSAAAPSPLRDELAEPMVDRPRIVEAPELPPPAPALGGISIEPVHEPEPERRPGFDLPLQSAPLSRRIFAGGIDAFAVATALTVFGYIFLRFNPHQPMRVIAELTAVLWALLWPAYQYAFLVFSGTTPGLRLAKLAVTRFDGSPASRSLRRWRVIASLLSAISLGLGYAWCFLDEDQLSWHDRITRTHLAPR
jgi:uncharacterized RDD family membrane protein YckC